MYRIADDPLGAGERASHLPYPDPAKCTGAGSIDEAENFKRAKGTICRLMPGV